MHNFPVSQKDLFKQTSLRTPRSHTHTYASPIHNTSNKNREKKSKIKNKKYQQKQSGCKFLTHSKDTRWNMSKDSNQLDERLQRVFETNIRFRIKKKAMSQSLWKMVSNLTRYAFFILSIYLFYLFIYFLIFFSLHFWRQKAFTVAIWPSSIVNLSKHGFFSTSYIFIHVVNSLMFVEKLPETFCFSSISRPIGQTVTTRICTVVAAMLLCHGCHKQAAQIGNTIIVSHRGT